LNLCISRLIVLGVKQARWATNNRRAGWKSRVAAAMIGHAVLVGGGPGG